MDRPLPADGGSDDSAYEHLRSEPRDSMFLMATLRRPNGPEVAVKVRNLSSGGMMAECPMSFSRGEPIETDMRGIGQVKGKVVWAAGGRIGVAFDRMVDPRLARKPVATAAPPIQLVKAARTTWRPGVR